MGGNAAYDMIRFNYSVIRSRRKSFTVKVTAENEVIVRAPLSASDAAVERVLLEKQRWLQKALAFNAANAKRAEDAASYKTAYVDGIAVPVIFGSRNRVAADGVHVTSPSSFRAAYVGSLGDAFIARFRDVERQTGLKSSSVSFRAYKSRWGCCDGSNAITFNFKLMMLPRHIQRYVMVHELCHTVHHNHSADFWSLVGRFEPRYKQLASELKKYTFIAKLYQPSR